MISVSSLNRRFKKSLRIMMCGFCIAAGGLAVSSDVEAAGAGKTWTTTDEITSDINYSIIMSGYIEDYAVMENGSILGVFRTPDAKSSVRFFLENDGSGLKKDSIDVVKQCSGTVNKVLLEGRVHKRNGSLEVIAFCVAYDRG